MQAPCVAGGGFVGRIYLQEQVKQVMPREDTQWRSGQSGNPKGRPPGSRDQLTKAFIDKLAEDFEANGEAAIERCRNDDPAAYLRLIASLAPKKVNVDGGITLLDYFAALAVHDAEDADNLEDEPDSARH